MPAALVSPLLFTAVMATTICVMLHISIRNEGWRPALQLYRIRRALVGALLSWSLAILAAHGI